jgi:asparagine synthase (glutamine-hydrolysing)
VAAAEPSPSIASGPEWLLTAGLDDPHELTLTTGALAERGALRGFLDGFLFDRDDLASSLGQTAARSTDVDLVLAACERHGDGILARLRGSFAVAIHDRSRATTVVARDPLGAHPLFYCTRGSSVLFATHPKVLIAQPGVSSALNKAALADHLCSRWPDPHETFFDAVRRVPPGWSVVLSGGRLRLHRYWDPVPHADRPIEWLTTEEAERFDEKLEQAVRRCVTVGRSAVFLSGGFDSVSIAAMASDVAGRAGFDRPRALSLAFPHPECNERDRQIQVARSLGLTHEILDFHEAAGPRGLLGNGLALNHGLASPLFNCWAPAYLELARRAAAHGVRVILTGSGGDEWLGVSPFLGADLLRRGNLSGFIRFTKTWARSYDQAPARVLHSALWTFGLRPIGGMLMHRLMRERWDRSRLARGHQADPDWVAPDHDLRRELRQRAPLGLAAADPPGGFYARESRAFLDHSLMSRDLEEQYEFGALNGVRYMHPYWDADLAAQIYRTPPELLMKGGRTKGLVRETLARRFPGLGFERQRKVSALSFFRGLAIAEGPALARSVGRFEALAALGVVDAGGASAFVDESFRTQSRGMFVACHLFNLEVWTRDYVN